MIYLLKTTWHNLPLIIGISILAGLLIYALIDWFVWTFGRDEIDTNHFRRMR